MRRLSYFKRASRRFLQGTRHRTPAEAVEAGSRTLEQWVNILSEERELEGVFVQERKVRLQQRRSGIGPQASHPEPMPMLAPTSTVRALNV
jgi:hypothetical protein